MLLFCAGFQCIYTDQDILRSDRIVSGVPVVRLLAIQAGDGIQRDAGYSGIRQSGQFAHDVSNNGIISMIRRYMKEHPEYLYFDIFLTRRIYIIVR